MDHQEQSPDQRVKLRRSREDWEQLACKVLLYKPDWALWLRDNYEWRVIGRDPDVVRGINQLIQVLGISGTCAPLTFVNGIVKALRRMARDARINTKLEKIRDRRSRTE